MFDESVVVTHGGESQTLKAAVFIDGTGDALTDAGMDSDREDILIVCEKRDWAYVQKLRRGDAVRRQDANGVTYKVSEVKNDYLMGWCVHARSV